LVPPEEAAEKLPPWFADVRDSVARGRYPGAFDYKYVLVSEEGVGLHVWVMLLWDRIIAIVAFHDPDDAAS
jgi:hypothetical protein